MKTFEKLLQAEIKKRESVISELQENLANVHYNPNAAFELRFLISQEKLVLVPLKKVLAAYKKQEKKK